MATLTKGADLKGDVVDTRIADLIMLFNRQAYLCLPILLKTPYVVLNRGIIDNQF